MTTSLRNSPEFAALRELSERLGTDPQQVQGPGGNTSLKDGKTMLVKASGTWLAEARERDIMVPLRYRELRAALFAGAPEAESGVAFVAQDDNPSGLRPSIETSVHGLIDWPVVLHTHCVATIAVAVRADAQSVVADRLAGLDAAFIPYARPGGDLARAIMERLKPETRILVLGNHGLVACGETTTEAEALLKEASRRLGREAAPGCEAAAGLSKELDGSGWVPAPAASTQAIACDPTRLDMASGAALYPDHVIFLGPGAFIARDGEAVRDALARIEASEPPQKLALFPGAGAVVPENASPSTLALAQAFGDVLARIEPGAELTRLTPEQELSLLNWDAEKYRQALEAKRAAEA